MKAIFISFNQAYEDDIVAVLDANGQRGFTRWENVDGRGSVNGEPHYGNHAWPVQNNAILTVVEDDKVPSILKDLRNKDERTPKLGLRTFVWDVSESI
jgi:nitrogen regulatory protein PII